MICTYELTLPSRVPSSFANAGSQWYGLRTNTRPEIETKTWRSDDLLGLASAWFEPTTHFHVSLLSPCHVPKIDRHTLPSSYRFAAVRRVPAERRTITTSMAESVRMEVDRGRFVWELCRVQVDVKYERSVGITGDQLCQSGCNTHGVPSGPTIKQRNRSVRSSYERTMMLSAVS